MTAIDLTLRILFDISVNLFSILFCLKMWKQLKQDVMVTFSDRKEVLILFTIISFSQLSQTVFWTRYEAWTWDNNFCVFKKNVWFNKKFYFYMLFLSNFYGMILSTVSIWFRSLDPWCIQISRKSSESLTAHPNIHFHTLVAENSFLQTFKEKGKQVKLSLIIKHEGSVFRDLFINRAECFVMLSLFV